VHQAWQRAIRRLAGKARLAVSARLPNQYVLNYLLSSPAFANGNGRLPRRPASANATINDYIFDRMIRNNWTPLERRCVDKEYAKSVARSLAANIGVAETRAIFRVRRATTVTDVAEWMQPFLGRRLVMKPTHASGLVLFLDRKIAAGALSNFVRRAKQSHFHVFRETQYAGLEKKILIEDRIGGADAPTDYKFFCIRGKAEYLQIDVDRFSGHKRRLLELPSLKKLDVRTGHDLLPEVSLPANIGEMIAAAENLATPFEFVRIDLYNDAGATYFGEFTFAPDAAVARISDETWGIGFLNKVKQTARN
jgi:hypothetical protein